jgi:SAM-dependent methyltransferase
MGGSGWLQRGKPDRVLLLHFCWNTHMKQYSDACEQNKSPILSILSEVFRNTQRVLEIGSGTGQHAVHFARHLPHLYWQTSDLPENHASISAWVGESGLENLAPPLDLDVISGHWPRQTFDGVFSANTTHIMHWPAVQCMFAGIGARLENGGVFCLYGPFNYDNVFTSPGNARFDDWLRSRDPDSGIRNFEDLDTLAHIHGLHLQADHAMPVNNRLLVWVK